LDAEELEGEDETTNHEDHRHAIRLFAEEDRTGNEHQEEKDPKENSINIIIDSGILDIILHRGIIIIKTLSRITLHICGTLIIKGAITELIGMTLEGGEFELSELALALIGSIQIDIFTVRISI
jgi:hypothetical protein